ncbi:MAG: OadG family protein [Candidatus Brocadiia bacterium]
MLYQGLKICIIGLSMVFIAMVTLILTIKLTAYIVKLIEKKTSNK